MEIRLLNPSDAESYWELRLEALQQNPEAFATSYEEALKRENPIEQVASRLQGNGDFTFGAFHNGKLIGVVTLLQEKVMKMAHKAYILAMYVTPGNRGKSVGKAILTEAINHAKQNSEIMKLNLTVVSSNESAKKLYASLGFKAYGYEKAALKVNDKYYDEEHMVLFLQNYN
ncbi:GNAT family N-acetyltransferase [Bacillus sp. NEB1478]|uniref:GNAT family N-acetyltransferase n=1 Tax=Bacillus sp. NEB1478 TaxID=3073816 RepID=UPI002872BC85|nr:GNAT family N-acetyltransferase [Bacillus sp. NEB1478]WNB91690.1 GNAT family N-acetyltransferase [Bacillus sp. NEB1478]